MGRPPDPATQTEVRDCPEHGLVEFRRHRVGLHRGKVKYRWRCPLCHAEKNR